MNMQEKYNVAIYIIGPDLEDRYETDLNFLNAKFNKVIVIGDGKKNILNADGTGPLQKLYTINDDHQELQNAEKVLVYIHAHGTAQNDTHYIITTKEKTIFESKKLFALLAESIKKPIDIIFAPCNGKAALKDIDALPTGSKIIIFSDSDKFTTGVAIHTTISKILSDSKFTLDEFYNNYLTNVHLMDESPIISIVGGNTIDPIVK